jgi:hypothetical protein
MGLQNEDWGSALRASGPLAEAHGIVLRGASDAISRYSREEGHLGIRDRGGIHQRLLWPIAEGPVVNNVERSAAEKKALPNFRRRTARGIAFRAQSRAATSGSAPHPPCRNASVLWLKRPKHMWRSANQHLLYVFRQETLDDCMRMRSSPSFCPN